MRRSLLRTLIGAGAALSVLTASSATAGATVELALSFDPNPAKPGHPVIGSVTAPPEAAGGETDCWLEFDGQVVPTRCRDSGNGVFQAAFTVPGQAKPGSHVVAG